MKNYGLKWWLTEIIGLILIAAVIVFEGYINYSLFINPFQIIVLSKKEVIHMCRSEFECVFGSCDECENDKETCAYYEDCDMCENINYCEDEDEED
jgi:hypothetical protein